MGCGKPPPPKPPPAELDVTGPASFAGSWVTDGELDWYYALTVGADGRYVMTVDRGKMGRCEQKGMLQTAGDPRAYQLVYEKNTCTPVLGGGPFAATVESFTGPNLTLAIEGVPRTFARDPKSVEQ